MQQRKSATFLRSLLFCSLLFTQFFLVNNCYAYEGVRVEEENRNGIWDASSNTCDLGGLKFDPLTTNRDIKWVISNPTCAGFIVGTAVAVKAAEYYSSYACLQPQLAAEITAQAATGVPISPDMIKRRAQEASTCGALLASQNYGQAAMCCGGLAASTAAMSVAVGALAIIWDIANKSYKETQICGYRWAGWESQNVGGYIKWTKSKGPHQKCLENAFNGTTYPCGEAIDGSSRDIKNKHWREFIYGGMEFEDNGGGSCENPASWDSDKRKRILGYDSDAQRYYMTGPGAVPIFACSRFRLSGGNKDQAAVAAYECCKARSQVATCLQEKDSSSDSENFSYKFCTLGSRCNFKMVTFEAYNSKVQSNYICLRSYSVCPYDHPLAGGTEEKKMSEQDNSQMLNFCQYLNHCTKIPVLPKLRSTKLDNSYIAQACRDMKGDSQNTYSYSQQLLPISLRSFSAPIVQCFKETMENVFFNRAGFTKCHSVDEDPDENDECTSGYDTPGFKKGQIMSGQSFFGKIQDNLQEFIKICVTLAVVAFGFAVFMAVPGAHIKKDVVMMFLLKISLVMFFAVGDGWQNHFMNGVLSTANYLSDFAFHDEGNDIVTSGTATTTYIQNNLDGCQFPRYNYADKNDLTKYSNPAYPPGKEYLRIWDTLDCKLIRALGFGQEVSVPNLVMMILGGFLTGGLGVMFFVGTFLFAFFLLSIVLRGIHIFLMSMTLVVLLVYVSPITIVAAMFKRTNGIFDKWWKELLAQVLQPMILFVYLGIVVTMFDRVIVGADITFSPSTVKIGDVEVVDSYGRISPKAINCSGAAADSSLYCIFKVSDIQTWGGFAPLGVGLPMLGSFNQTKLNTIIKSAFIMFILLHFIDHISEIAKSLVGGGIGMAGGITDGLAGKALDIGKGIQKRGKGALKKGVGFVGRKGIGGAKGLARAIGGRGKSIAKNLPMAGPNADAARSQGDTGGNADRAASQGDGSINKNADSAASQPVKKGPQGADSAGSSGDVGGSKKPGGADSAGSV